MPGAYFRGNFVPATVIPHTLLTVIPAQTGIHKYRMGSMTVFGIAVLDSRLRGNDGGEAQEC